MALSLCRVVVVAGVFLLWPWAPSLRAEILDGSGFHAINWNMHVADVEKSMGGQVARVRNEHTGSEYLRGERFQYLGCTYVFDTVF
jgi:hypothetical protein